MTILRVVLLSVVVVGGPVWFWRTRPTERQVALMGVAVTGLTFQMVHAAEHMVQLSAWIADPDQPPFLTPWAVVGRDALAVGGDGPLGNELLHLLGNVVFLVGLVALAAIGRRSATRCRALSVALAVQGAHVAEHVALTITTATVGEAIGVTTLFGLLDAGPALWTLRVIAHFVLNGLATAAAALAVVSVTKRTGASLVGV